MKAVETKFQGYILRACPIKTYSNRWSPAVQILPVPGETKSGRIYYADDGISYILEEEAAKESLNLGRNLIKMGIL